MERGRMRGVDLYGRSPLDGGLEAASGGSFHSIPCGWVGQGGWTDCARLKEAKGLKSRFCAETPALPLKKRIKAQN